MFPFFPETDYDRRYNRPIWPSPKVAYNTVLDVKFVEGSSTPTEPVALQEFKDWGKIDVSEDDTLIEDLLISAREYVEGYLCTGLISRTVIAILDNSNGNQYLPYGPVTEIVSVKDYLGTEIPTDNYRIELEDFKRLAWPCLKYIRLEYVAGYSTIPRKIKTGLMQQALWWYQHRGDEEFKSQMGPDAEATLQPYRRVV